jgi:hypothetical protein
MELYNKEFVYFDWDDKLEGKKGFFADNINDLKQHVENNDISWFRKIFKNSRCNDNDDTAYPFETMDESFWRRNSRFCYYDPYYEFRKAYLEGKQLQFKNSDGEWEDVDGKPSFINYEYRIKPDDIIRKVVLSDDGALSIAKTTDKHVYFEGTGEECSKWINEHSNFADIMWAWERETKPIQFYDDYCDKWRNCKDSDDEPCEPNWRVGTEYRIKEEYVPFDTVQELIDAWKKKSGIEFNRELLMPLIWIRNKVKNRVYLITDFLFDKAYNCDVGTEDENLKLTELFENFTFLDGSIIGKEA